MSNRIDPASRQLGPREPAAPCPDPEQLAAFVEGRVDEAAWGQVAGHVSVECSSCRREVAALLASPETERAGPLRVDRRIWLFAAAAAAATVAAAMWWTAPPAGAAFERRLLATVAALTAAEPRLFAEFRPLSATERTGPAPVHRSPANVALTHPRGRVLSDRPHIRFSLPATATSAHLRVTAIDTGELVGELELPALARNRGESDWALDALTRGRSYQLTLLADGPLGPAVDEQVIAVATAAAAADTAAAWTMIERHAAADLVPALRADYALRQGFAFEAEQAAGDWLQAMPDLPAAQATADLVRRGGR